MTSPYERFVATLETAGRVMEMSNDMIARIAAPERAHTVTIPVKRDSGRWELFTGFRVQHNSARGPYKGGIRYHPQVSLDEVQALASWMSMKTAVVNIPLGGGKGGIVVDPKKLSGPELEALTRGFAERIYRDIGPEIDIPAPDVNTDSHIMDWIADEYGKLTGTHAPGVVTGKSIAAGGSAGRDTATAQGGYFVLESCMKERGESFEGKRVAIQGFGNAGANFAKLMHAAGAKVVAASDSTAALASEDGLPVVDLIQYKAEGGHFSDMTANFRQIDALDILTYDCDILVPSALEDQIDAGNAAQVKGRYVVELANGPTSSEADTELESRNIVVLPDILANAGGVVVSCFEWQQNVRNERWTADDVRAKLADTMDRAWASTSEVKTGKNVSYRLAAYCVAIDRIADAIRSGGATRETAAASTA